jgi:hypothetical protein
MDALLARSDGLIGSAETTRRVIAYIRVYARLYWRTSRDVAAVGIYPPPYYRDERRPESILRILVGQERWQDPPSMAGIDEEGVDRQIEDFEANVADGLRKLNQPRDPNAAIWRF